MSVQDTVYVDDQLCLYQIQSTVVFLPIYNEGHTFLQKTIIIITLTTILSKHMQGGISCLTS